MKPKPPFRYDYAPVVKALAAELGVDAERRIAETCGVSLQTALDWIAGGQPFKGREDLVALAHDYGIRFMPPPAALLPDGLALIPGPFTVEVPSVALQSMLAAAADLQDWGKTCKLVLTLGRDGKLKTIAIDTE